MEEKEKKELQDIARHTMSHVLAAAVKELYGDVKFGIGPAIESGFYYDFDLPQNLSPENFKEIEEKMKQIIAQNLDMTKQVI